MSFMPRTLEELAHEWPPEIGHISATSLKMIERCPEQWRQRYVLGKISPPNLDMLGGRADHAAIEHNLVQKMSTGEDLRVGEVREKFTGTLEYEVERSGGLDEIHFPKLQADTRAAKRRVYDKARVLGEKCVAAYHTEVSHTLDPVRVEEEFEIALESVPVKLVGRIDLEVRQQGVNFNTIIDRKRTGRAPSGGTVSGEWKFQAGIYQLVRPLPHQWHVSIFRDLPDILHPSQFPWLEQSAPSERDSARWLRSVQQSVAKIGFLYQRYGPDEGWPIEGQRHPWACSYCGWKDDCWAWNDTRKG